MPEAAIETAAPDDDIRFALAAAITEHEAPESAIKAEPESAVPPTVESAEKTGEPTRGPDGKFAKKAEHAEPEAAEKTETAEEPLALEKTDDKLPPETQKALSGWKSADQAMFQKQSPEAQEFLMRRHKEMTADYTKKLQDVSRIKTEYESVDKLFDPYRDVMKQKGLTVPQLIESWAGVEKKLASGHQGALEVIGGLINGYKVPRDKIAALIGIRPQIAPAETATAESQQPQPQSQIQLPPEILQALQKIPTIERAVTGLTTAQRQVQQAAINAAGDRAMREIEEFKSATDAKGALLRPHFDDVEQDMLRLANAAIAAKQSVPAIAELYETAVWANPSTREKLLTARQQAEEQKRVDQDKAKSAAARKASVSVTGAPGSGQASQIRGTPDISLHDQIATLVTEQSAA